MIKLSLIAAVATLTAGAASAQSYAPPMDIPWNLPEPSHATPAETLAISAAWREAYARLVAARLKGDLPVILVCAPASYGYRQDMIWRVPATPRKSKARVIDTSPDLLFAREKAALQSSRPNRGCLPNDYLEDMRWEDLNGRLAPNRGAVAPAATVGAGAASAQSPDPAMEGAFLAPSARDKAAEAKTVNAYNAQVYAHLKAIRANGHPPIPLTRCSHDQHLHLADRSDRPPADMSSRLPSGMLASDAAADLTCTREKTAMEAKQDASECARNFYRNRATLRNGDMCSTQGCLDWLRGARGIANLKNLNQ